MSRTKKTFTAATADVGEKIPFSVELTNEQGEKKTMDFEAYGTAPGDATMTLTHMARVTKDGVATIDASGMAEFMDNALVGDGPERWREMVADKEWKIPAEIIGDVVTHIQEEWAGRPTPRLPSSSPGQPSTSDNSTELPSSTA